MIWIITAMIWHHDLPQPVYSTFQEKSFESKIECLDYVFWEKGDLVYKLVEVHGVRNGQQIKTWTFFCESEEINEV